MDRKRVFLTGMSGYLGRCLCRELDRSAWCERFYGMDARKPLAKYDRAEFRLLDINDPVLVDWAREVRPDIFIHLAFIVDPIPDEELMHRVNVGGTRNALRAAAESGASQVMVFSSGTAYGAWPDNPVPLREDDPIRPHPSFRYAADKSEVESLCKDFMKEHPEVITSVLRPCVVYGPQVNNYLSGLLTMPILTTLREHNSPLQFVHEDDVVGAVLAILDRQGRGAFNVAPPDTMTIQEAVALAGRPSLRLPEKVIEPILQWTWSLQLPFFKAPPSLLDFIRYPWILDSSRLREEIGYTFRYSTRETVEIMLRAKGILA